MLSDLYCFVFTEGKFNDNIKVGGKLQLQLKIKNEGFAAPFNPCDVQIILTKKKTGEKHIFKVNTDPRRWAAGSTGHDRVHSHARVLREAVLGVEQDLS